MINWLKTRRYWPWWIYIAIAGICIFLEAESPRHSWQQWAAAAAAVIWLLMGILSIWFPPYHPRRLSPQEEVGKRWERLNKLDKASGCNCGAPATHVLQDFHGAEVRNGVPVEFWTCEEHVGVVAWRGSQPAWTRTSPCSTCDYVNRGARCSGTMNHSDDEPYLWFCPEKPDEPIRALP